MQTYQHPSCPIACESPSLPATSPHHSRGTGRLRPRCSASLLPSILRELLKAACPPGHPLHLGKAGGSGRDCTSAAKWGRKRYQDNTVGQDRHRLVPKANGIVLAVFTFFKALEWTAVFFRTAELSGNSAVASFSWNWLPYYGCLNEVFTHPDLSCNLYLF